MRDALKYLFYFGALLAVGPIAAMALEPLRLAISGGPATLLTGHSMPLGFAAGLGIVVLAGVMGVITSKIVGVRWGLAAAGMVLVWPAVNSATMLDLARAQPAGLPAMMMTLAIEGLFLAVLAAVAAGAMDFISQQQAPASDLEELSKSQAIMRFGVMGLQARKAPPAEGLTWLWIALAVLLSAVAGFIGIMLVAKSMLKGQTIAASAVGGLLAAMVVTIRHRRMPIWTIVLGVMLASVIGQLAGGLGLLGTNTQLLNRTLDGSILASLRPTPLHVLAGVFIGLPLGLSMGDFFRGWASSTASVTGSTMNRRAAGSGGRA